MGRSMGTWSNKMLHARCSIPHGALSSMLMVELRHMIGELARELKIGFLSDLQAAS